MRGKIIAAVAAIVAVGVGVGVAVAAVNGNFATHLQGRYEVPLRDTDAQGQATLKLSKDGQSIDYKLIASNIDNVIMAHIHIGDSEHSGPIAVWLYPGTAPPQAPNGGGRHDGVLVEGTFTASNFIGPLAGQPMSALLDAIAAGNAYVNIHTNDGVAPANTGPGDFPGGEIRGQLP